MYLAGAEQVRQVVSWVPLAGLNYARRIPGYEAFSCVLLSINYKKKREE
jgi:hypothetical protein